MSSSGIPHDLPSSNGWESPDPITGLTGHGTTSMRVADALRTDILGGVLPPGTRIRQEEVAARLGASRVPVREALRILEADGLVTLVANTGAWVARLSLAECEEVYQIRERVEPLLLRYAAPHHSDDQLRELEELAVRMEGSADVEEFLRRDREFHLLSYRAAETAVLSDLVHRLWNTTQHYRRAFATRMDRRSRRVVHDEHHMITTALRDGDVTGAERVLEGHIRRTRRELARHPEIFTTTGE
ncbi:GntR family transcriptional regulator [Blastococcus sp. SYSU D00820]